MGDSDLKSLAQGIEMLSLYPIFVVMAILMVSILVLSIVEVYFLIASAYTIFGMWRLKDLKLRSLAIISASLVAASELILWLSRAEASGMIIMLLKSIFLFLVGLSIFLAGGKAVKGYSYAVMLGSAIVPVPYPLITLVAYALIIIGLFGASKRLMRISSSY